MTDIIEKNEFSPVVELLDLGDEVKGGVNGPSNKQAIALTARTRYLKNEQDKTNQRITNLTPETIGADPAGRANLVMTAHEDDQNAHPQYVSKAQALLEYVQLNTSNQANGYLKLDENGKIPADLISLLTTSYVVVADEAGRLALVENPNLVIVAQADIDTLFYLNGGLDPSVPGNWVRGQAATVSGVSRVFGRTGEILAQAGDYTTEQITETLLKMFVSQTDKTTWSGKQDKLKSGETIKTIFGVSLLGEGNAAPTPDQMGSATKNHTHTSDQISDFNEKVLELLGTHLKSGPGISIGYNTVTGDTTVSSTGGGGGGDDKQYLVVDALASIAGQNHTYSFSPQNAYNLTAYALKSEAGKSNQTYLQDNFPAGSEAIYNKTDGVVLNNSISVSANLAPLLIQSGSLYKAEITTKGKKVVFNSDGNASIVPPMTSNTTPVGYTVSSASQYDSTSPPWLLFDDNLATIWASLAGGTPQAPQWIRVKLPSKARVSRYSICNRQSGYVNSPYGWTLQGSPDGGATWVTLDTRSSPNNTAGAVRTFSIATPGDYDVYQLNITAQNAAGACTFAEIRLLGGENSKFIFEANNKFYAFDNTNFTEITDTITPALIIERGTNNATLNEAQQAFLGDSYKLVTGENFTIKGTITPFDQIVMNRNITNASKWDKLNTATIVQTLTGGAITRFAVTRDKTEYFVFNGAAWVSIGALTADTAGATKLIAQGMTMAVLNAITQTQWSLLYNNGVMDGIGFAYGISIPDATTDAATISSNTLNVNEVGSWKLQTPAEVEIRWYADAVSFRNIAAGDYKFGYQIP